MAQCFLKALEEMRVASCWTSDLHMDIKEEEEEGHPAMTEAQTVEEKPPCVHDPDQGRMLLSVLPLSPQMLAFEFERWLSVMPKHS